MLVDECLITNFMEKKQLEIFVLYLFIYVYDLYVYKQICEQIYKVCSFVNCPETSFNKSMIEKINLVPKSCKLLRFMNSIN